MQAYPTDYGVILHYLIAACKDRRIRASSTHSLFKEPDYRMHGGLVYVVVSGIEIMISDTGVHCLTHQLGNIKTIGSSVGDGGVWLNITAPVCEFWLEIHVPMPSVRQLQVKQERFNR